MFRNKNKNKTKAHSQEPQVSPDADALKALGQLASHYFPHTIEHSRMPEGGRSLEQYEEVLMFDRAKLAGKVVLDLGAGPDTKFAQELNRLGADAPKSVVSLSPDFTHRRHATQAKESGGKDLVAATGQALPFKDESFDFVAVLHVLDHLPFEYWQAFSDEVSRTLKKGGEARIGPLRDPDVSDYLQQMDDSPNGSYGVSVTTEQIPRDVFTARYYYAGGIGETVGGSVLVFQKS